MRREDFKEILPEHIRACKEIIKNNNDCTEIVCEECHFSGKNATNGLLCNENEYRRFLLERESGEEKTVVKSAKKFIELFEKGFEPDPIADKVQEKFDKTVIEICENTPGISKHIEDIVNQPNHYKLDGLDVEVLDVIKAVLSKEEFEGALHFNVMKYIMRSNKKNGVEDLKKAHKYLGWLIESRENLTLTK